MTFLKRVGQILAQTLATVTGLGPILAAFQPGAAPIIQRAESLLPRIIDIIHTTEAIGQISNLDGPAKLKAAAPLVGQEVLQFLAINNLKIKDPNRFAAAVTGLTSVVADLLNAVDGDVQTTDLKV